MLGLYKLKSTMLLALFTLVFTCSCRASLNIKNYSMWNINHRTSSVFTKYDPKKGQMFVSFTNSSGVSLGTHDDIQDRIRQEVKKKNISITNDKSEAKYRLSGNIRMIRKIHQREFESINEYWNMELSQSLLNDGMKHILNEREVDKQILQNMTADKVDLSFKFDNSRQQQHQTVIDVLSSYKNFDLSGVVVGAVAGFYLDVAGSAITGGIIGGFVFEGLSKLMEPNCYLAIIDVEIAERIDCDKNCPQVKKFESGVYARDDFSYSKQNIEQTSNEIIYRTTIYATSARIFAGRYESVHRLIEPLPNILSNQLR
jgi:hypothetical protein